MKKFLLSLCVLAVASVCVFMTSCKDEDDDAENNTVFAAIANTIAQNQDPTCTYTYTLTVGGKTTTYNSAEDLADALVELPQGTVADVAVVATLPDGTKKPGTSTKITVPGQGQKVSGTIEIPQGGSKGPKTGKIDITWPTTVTPQHNGGAAGN